jgi:lysophospholipase L1-like esterase
LRYPGLAIAGFALATLAQGAYGACDPSPTVPVEPANAWVAQRAGELQKEDWVKADMVLLGDSMLSRMPPQIMSVLSPGEPINLAMAGAQTNDVLWLLRGNDFRNLQPKIVIMLVGANDISHRKPACEVANNISQIVERIRGIWPSSRVILLTMPGFLLSPELAEERDRANGLMEMEFAGRSGISIIDLSSALACTQQNCTLYNPDHVHFNNDGYRVLMTLLEGRLRHE